MVPPVWVDPVAAGHETEGTTELRLRWSDGSLNRSPFPETVEANYTSQPVLASARNFTGINFGICIPCGFSFHCFSQSFNDGTVTSAFF